MGATGAIVAKSAMGVWRWPLVNLFALVVTVVINALANILRFNGQTTGDVINRDPTLFLPANWVFGIWGLIYAALALFVIYGLLPGGRRNERLQRIGSLFLISCAANCAWLFSWHWERLTLALVTIVALLLALLLIYLRLHRGGAARTVGERLCLRWPFSVYLAWVSVATIANATIVLDLGGWQGGGLAPAAWTAILLATEGVIDAMQAQMRAPSRHLGGGLGLPLFAPPDQRRDRVGRLSGRYGCARLFARRRMRATSAPPPNTTTVAAHMTHRYCGACSPR